MSTMLPGRKPPTECSHAIGWGGILGCKAEPAFSPAFPMLRETVDLASWRISK
jgi:hypothetical protein